MLPLPALREIASTNYAILDTANLTIEEFPSRASYLRGVQECQRKATPHATFKQVEENGVLFWKILAVNYCRGVKIKG